MIIAIFVSFVLVWGCFGMLCTEDDLRVQRRWLVAEIVFACTFFISAALWVLG